MKNIFLAVALGAASTLANASTPYDAPWTPASPAAGCDRIHTQYDLCGNKFTFDGSVFDFPNHSSLVCDDGRQLGFYDRMDSMDMAGLFLTPYQTGVTVLPETRQNWDPGRLRSEDLFKSVFGQNEGAVRANLVRVPFLNGTILFQKNLGAAAALEAVGREIMAEAALDPSLAKFMQPFTSGQLKASTFFWRNIAGTTRLSAHSFGTAVDLLFNAGPQYWLWEEKEIDPERAKGGEDAFRNIHFIPRAAPRFHPKAVAIFEKHGFVWGGKWNHYDTMHFEYRPEMIQNAQTSCSQVTSHTFEAARPEDFVAAAKAAAQIPDGD